MQFTVDVPITKFSSDEERMVYGFASVSTEDGKTVMVDRQGDTISEVELVKMAHNFVKGDRTGKEMHVGDRKAEVVESIVLRPEVSKALGLPEEFKKTGWFIGMKVHDDAVWQRVKKGELAAFSIGGKGKRKGVKKLQKDGRAGRDGDGDGQRDENGGRRPYRGIGHSTLRGAMGGAQYGAALGSSLGAAAGFSTGRMLGGMRGGLAFGAAHGVNSGLRGGLMGAGLGGAYGLARGVFGNRPQPTMSLRDLMNT